MTDGKQNISGSRNISSSGGQNGINVAASPPKALKPGPRVSSAAVAANGEPFPSRDTSSPPPHYVISYSVDYEDLEFYEHLGSGRYGSVSRALLRSRNTIVAVKKVESLGQEVNILSQLSHRNIVRFYGVYTNVVSTPHTRQLQFGIITEYCDNGSLYDLLKRIRPQISNDCINESDSALSFANIIQWANDIARGMNYLHSEAPVQIIHRDLKSTNVLLSRDWMCKICDFGSSRTRNRDNSIISVAGTPAWMAPELVRGEATFNSGCDVWSFGVVLWELLTCEQPFRGLDHYQVMFVVGSRNEHPPVPASCPSSFQGLLSRCWGKDPTSRPIFSEIVVELAKMLTDDDLPSEVANFTSATARRRWLMEVETELARVKLLEQSLEEREHDIAEREKQLAEQKRIVELQLQRLTPSASQGHLFSNAISPVERLDVLKWSEADVARWVRQLDTSIDHLRGLGKYANLFEANHISGRRLLLLSKSDFHAMGITSLGHQKQLIDEINFLRIASQMVVDFPPLQITTPIAVPQTPIASAVTPIAGDPIFQVGEDSQTSSRRQSTSSLTNQAGSTTIPDLSISSVMIGNGYHTPLSINVSNSSFILVENREFFVNIAVGMYTFPTTISESGLVKESTEYRVFIDANVSFDPSMVSSPDDAIAITDVDLTLDVANIFSSVFVIFDPDLPTERKICAATGLNESNPGYPDSLAPYVAKENGSPKLQKPFSTIEIEITLRHPYCCCKRVASTNGCDTNRESTTSDCSYQSAESSLVITTKAAEPPKNESSFEFVGLIRKRLAANFNAPIQTWFECVTQLSTKSSEDGGGGVHFQLTSPCGEGSMSPTSSSSPHCTVTASSGRTMKAALRANNVSTTPHSPRHLSLASITSPINGDDPVTFFSDARRNSVSVTSPNERPSSPAAAMIGQQVKAVNEHRLPYSGFFNPNHGSSPSMGHQMPTKTYASVAATAKPSGNNSSSLFQEVHHHVRHTRSEAAASPVHRHAIRNSQRQYRSGFGSGNVGVGGVGGSGSSGSGLPSSTQRYSHHYGSARGTSRISNYNNK